MRPQTKQFVWKDRDTAAHDLLQLVYHAPPFIALQAVSLLQAIRSPNIIPELLEIVDDDQREMWQRVYALRAIAATPGDLYLPRLESHMRSILEKRQIILKNHPKPDDAYLGTDMLDDIRDFVAHHPCNRQWFFEVLDENNPLVVRQFVIGSIYYYQPEEFRGQLLDYLLKLLDKHPEQITPSVIHTLAFEDDEIVKAWLDQHIDFIVEILCLDTTDPTVLGVAEQWGEARERLSQADADFIQLFDEYLVKLETDRQEVRTRRKEDLPDYRQSPAYNFLDSLYRRAADSDKQSYYRLVRIAKQWRGNIPLRAVATNLIGKLNGKFVVFPDLAYLVRYADVDWDDNFFDSPIRFEAGEALLQITTPETWEVLVDSYFIRPRDDLRSLQMSWIAHITDVLSGEDKLYSGIGYGSEEHRSWFRVLSEISEDEFSNI